MLLACRVASSPLAVKTLRAMASSSLHGKNLRSVLRAGAHSEPPLAPDAARLYSMRFCPFAQRAAIYLAAKGIRTDIVNINLAAKPECNFAKNPRGTVPTFESDGKAVYESLVVPEYLDGIYPESAVASPDPYTRAHHRILVEQLSEIVGGFTSGVFLALKGDRCDTEIAVELAKCSIALDECEKLAANNAPFFAGSTPGYPDYMVFPFFDRLSVLTTGVIPALRPTLADDVKQYTATDFPGSATWPLLTRWFDAAQRLDEVEASRQPRDAQAAFLKTYIGGAPDYDIGA